MSMSKEQTLSILKPDAVSTNHIGVIISRFETEGLKVVAAKMLHLSTEQAKAFYAVHAHRPFFQELVSFMIEGPVLIMVLEGDDAIAKNRRIMGATNPKEAEPGTIRADFAKSIEKNAVHGSDSAENAKQEITFFFKTQEIFSR
jgi:nucleoside-diphosphate kinase